MMEVDVTYVFDEILGRHMERLLGSRLGIGGLQLQIGTVACLTLLADQLEREQNGQPSYTTATLKTKLAELGFQDKEKAQTLIQEMTDKGYIIADDQGRITAGKPAASMAKLLEKVFPKLPGKTLVAYFIQTIDEVLTGRKTTEVAVAHFDQTLKMQGLPLKQKKSEIQSGAQGGARKQKQGAEHIVKETQTFLKSEPAALSPAVEESGGVRIIGSAGDGFRYKLRDIKKAPPTSPEAPAASPPEQFPENQPPAPEAPAEQPPESHPVCTEASAGPIPENQPVSMDSQPTPPPEEQGESQAFPEPSPRAEDTLKGGSPPEPEKEQERAEIEPEPPKEEDKPPVAEGVSAQDQIESAVSGRGTRQPEEAVDDLIEKEIAGFQNELASLCPLCKEGRVREEKTGTGRVYYKCTNKACNLVSWGRPHHISCPVCSNPFLVEISAGEEKVILQCPRATCKYQCTLSEGLAEEAKKKPAQTPVPSARTDAPSGKPRRRVVRRRLVRKKK